MGKLTELVKRAFNTQAEATSESLSSGAVPPPQPAQKPEVTDNDFMKLAEDLRKVATALPDDFDIEEPESAPQVSGSADLSLRDLLAQYAIDAETEEEEVQNE